MAEPRVSLESDQLSPAARRLQEPLEDQLSSALALATEQVRENYRGEPVDEVSAALLAATRDALHPDVAAAFQPDRAELRQVAEAIVAQAGG